MPSLYTNEFGMITYRPHVDEYNKYKDNCFKFLTESPIFTKMLIVEEKKCHYHIAFTLDYSYVKKTRESFAKLIRESIIKITGDYKDVKIAIDIAWPKKDDNWLKLLGYCVKGTIDNTQETEILFRRDINDEDITKAIESATANTKNTNAIEMLSTIAILNLMINYVTNVKKLNISFNEDFVELASRRKNSEVIDTYDNVRRRIPRPYEHLCQFKLLLVRNKKFYSLNDNMMDILWGQALLTIYDRPLFMEHAHEYKDFNVNTLLDKPIIEANPSTLTIPKNIILGDKEEKEGTTTKSVVPFFVDEDNNERLSKNTKSKSKTIPKVPKRPKSPKLSRYGPTDYSDFPTTEFATYR